MLYYLDSLELITPISGWSMYRYFDFQYLHRNCTAVYSRVITLIFSIKLNSKQNHLSMNY